MRIKICGLTSLEDALACAQAGADLLGFNFYERSRRCISPETGARISAEVRSRYPGTILVGVFVNERAEIIRKIACSCGLDLVQCSGDETPVAVKELGDVALKALRPNGEEHLQHQLAVYPARALPPAFLIDANRPGEYGGTGLHADWTLAATMAYRYPILLAGGLTPENVTVAIRQVHPWGVDVASGVERAPGRKDPLKIKAFITAARAAAEE